MSHLIGYLTSSYVPSYLFISYLILSYLFIILVQLATPEYYLNLSLLNLDLLSERRTLLSTNFAKKTFKHPVHSKMFVKNTARPSNHSEDCRQGCNRGGRKVIEPLAKRVRYEKSAVPSLSRLLNAL